MPRQNRVKCMVYKKRIFLCINRNMAFTRPEKPTKGVFVTLRMFTTFALIDCIDCTLIYAMVILECIGQFPHYVVFRPSLPTVQPWFIKYFPIVHQLIIFLMRFGIGRCSGLFIPSVNFHSPWVIHSAIIYVT